MEKAFKACCTVATADDDGVGLLLLHGVLQITIDELKFEKLSSSLWADMHDHLGGCRAIVELPPIPVGQTTAQQHHNGSVIWQETVRAYCANEVSAVVISLNGHGYNGKAQIPAWEILEKRHIDGWFSVDGKVRNHGKIHITLEFLPANKDPLWGAGVGDPYSFPGVPNTFFPLRKGCKVTPYQNSHVEEDFLPPIALPGDRRYQPGKYWAELHQAILDAKKFVYIAGWSMFAEIALVRGYGGQWLGESLKTLLIRRADEGVRVLIMVWDDKTDNLDGLISKEGLMHTHDEDTHDSFKGTKVRVFRCPRNPKVGMFHVMDSLIFTHHQKAVVLDAPAVDPHPSDLRRLVAFVGGIDLCGGRFDTPTHSLFRTLNTVHRKDFHQESLPGAKLEMGGPRQPWHDIHSKIEGEVAWDVHTNFAQRWEYQGGEKLAAELVDITDSDVFCPPSPVLDELDVSAWNVQLLRSIDSSSVEFPTDPKTTFEKGLVREKLIVVERSIQDAYICAIRRAKRFIFIENQYFMGSSFAWKGEPELGPEIPNLIPVELALKIASKIRAGERFSVYIIIPMAPNGPPASTSVQDLLHHQRRSMEMMYRIIAETLEEEGRASEHPTDFLSFFCLGNREAHTTHEYVPEKRPPKGTHYHKAQENRRFPIYVHAKLIIVDDEYLIIGSANINQRAMDGSRDSEMAMSAYQPLFTVSKSVETPRGEVYAFRISLWYEHMGLLDPVFDQPWELECMNKVRMLAAENWDDYTHPGPPMDLKRHILLYPVSVAQDGKRIYTQPGSETFPDTDGSIMGAQKPKLPVLLTA